jgi:hypothetical protein
MCRGDREGRERQGKQQRDAEVNAESEEQRRAGLVATWSLRVPLHRPACTAAGLWLGPLALSAQKPSPVTLNPP